MLGLPVAWAAESVPLAVGPASTAFLQEWPGDEPLMPGRGEVVVAGRFEAPAFYVDDLRQIAVSGPDGVRIPLQVDGGSLFVEFDQIVSLRFAFLAAEADVQGATGGFVLEWGPDVAAENVRLENLALDAERPELYRAFRPAPPAPASGDDVQVASIEVIADSTAEYHFLYYLLPMALIFLLLSVRKVRARHPAG